VELLRLRHPRWHLGRCDLLNRRSSSVSPLVKPTGPTVDAVVLNPPFSCRGGRTITSTFLGAKVRSSLAMAFVLRSLERVRPGGQIATLLPAGSSYSEKDELAWRLLDANATVRLVDGFGRDEFKGAFSRTVLVHMRRANAPKALKGSSVESVARPSSATTTLCRGSLPMHRAKSGTCQVVHTTELRAGEVASVSSGRAPSRLGLKGPLLLIPRVGLPNSGKISIYPRGSRIVLSDCVFAVTGPLNLLEDMQTRILMHWDLFRTCYGGSCAPYTTTKRLLAMLRALGADVAPEARLRRFCDL
jgi:hypothetical protein